MTKGKAPIMEEKVVWTTGLDPEANYCVGLIRDDADKSLIIKEANNAPIDKETLKSRVSLIKQRKAVANNPGNSGYAEQYVALITSKMLDDEDIKEIKLPYVSEGKGSDIVIHSKSLTADQIKKISNSKLYKFRINEPSNDESL